MSFVMLGHVQTNLGFVYLLIPRISEGFKFCEKNKKHILAAFHTLYFHSCHVSLGPAPIDPSIVILSFWFTFANGEK